MKVLIKHEGAQAGVGTLIIFIAMVLVAAVAAAVLIQTSSVMQSKSTTTTKEASEAITENVIIESVFGTVSGSSNLSYINMTVRIGPGSGAINLTKVVVLINGGNKTADITSLRDLNTTTTILSSGSLASLGVDVSDLDLISKDAMIISIVPEKGTTTNMPITLPTLTADDENIALYP